MDRRLECDNDFILTSGARFHTDPTNMYSGVVPITTGKSSEILWSWLVGSRRKGSLRGVWYHMLGTMAKEVTFLIHLWRNILKMYLGNIIDTHYSVSLRFCLDTLGVSYIREYIYRVLLPECH
jgi:hypothetical protein